MIVSMFESPRKPCLKSYDRWVVVEQWPRPQRAHTEQSIVVWRVVC